MGYSLKKKYRVGLYNYSLLVNDGQVRTIRVHQTNFKSNKQKYKKSDVPVTPKIHQGLLFIYRLL